MKAAAALYTVASVAVLALMIMRPPVDVSNPAEASPAQETPSAVPATSTAAPAVAPATPQPVQAPAPVQTPVPAPATPQFPPADTSQPAPTGEAVPDEKKNDAGTVAKPAPTSSATPDYAREQRIASEITDTILDGEVVTLNDGSHDFMGILTTAEQPRGAVIILHGRGTHPDWEDVAHPLRTGLVEKGWTTLSLQMPVLEKEAKYYDYLPLLPNADKRIDAGIAYLKQQGIAPIVLAAHSCGAHMAMHWAESKGGDNSIAAYVGLGMGATDYQQDMAHPFPLDRMKVPVLDVYGEKEYPQVISMAPERKALIQKAGNPASKQMVLPAADHYFKDKGQELTAVVATWLNSLPL